MEMKGKKGEQRDKGISSNHTLVLLGLQDLSAHDIVITTALTRCALVIYYLCDTAWVWE